MKYRNRFEVAQTIFGDGSWKRLLDDSVAKGSEVQGIVRASELINFASVYPVPLEVYKPQQFCRVLAWAACERGYHVLEQKREPGGG